MFYLYRITYWDNYGDGESTGTGLCFASSYAEAADKVIKDYGSDVIDIYLQQLEDSLRTLTKDEALEAFKEGK